MDKRVKGCECNFLYNRPGIASVAAAHKVLLRHHRNDAKGKSMITSARHREPRRHQLNQTNVSRRGDLLLLSEAVSFLIKALRQPAGDCFWCCCAQGFASAPSQRREGESSIN